MILLLLLAIQFHLCLFSDIPSPPLFRVNLDLPPRERWIPVLNAFNNTDLVTRIGAQARAFVPRKLQPLVFGLFARLAHFLPYEYAEELRGIAGYLHGGNTGIGLGELVALNILYDLSDFQRHMNNVENDGGGQSESEAPPPPARLGCTSIVAARPDGHIFHGRNLDYGMTQLLKDATILVDFVRNGTVEFTAVAFLLHIGVLTGQRANALTVSLNARFSGGPWDNVLMELLTRFHHPVSFEIRRVLDQGRNFLGALDHLSRVPMIAPAYIILGGTNGDGAIITRDRLGAADVFPLDYLHYRWFLLETNYDPWKRARDKRRRYGWRYMMEMGQLGLSADALFRRVLAKSPIKNSETIYTTVMSAQHPELIYKFTKIWSTR